MSDVKYISTRGEAPELGFEDVVLAGLARDGGLYVPLTWPRFAPDQIAAFAGRPFAGVAADVVASFAGGAIDHADLERMADDAYATFGHAAVTPLVQIDRDRFVLELFHGPTLAFKDVAMQFIARVMDHILVKRDGRATIVGATSGDTGGAAVEAFRGSERLDVIILFPEGRVSDVQRRMMTTPSDSNVHAVAIKGTFDDCQALVKGLFNDHAFRDRVSLTGVNSINWARIVAQVTYYFVAAAALGGPHRPVSFSVPTGNFGDIFAGFAARRMGLPIEKLIIATNDNDILRRAHEAGVYEMSGVVATSSPSMDIQISSNFERYLFEASGRDAGRVKAQMQALAQGGRFDLGAQADAMRAEFAAHSASEREVEDAIRQVERDSGYVMDPHTACAWVALDKSGRGRAPGVVLSTAHPAKFPDAMQAITGKRPALPLRLASLMTDKERFDVLPNDLGKVKQHVAAVARAVEGAA
jgi:threonine synthase